MENNINEVAKEVGKIESLVSLVEGENKIVIPIIQRDYAQGRDNEKVVRGRFLGAIKDHLGSNKHPLELDFIYGSLKDRRYTILDGQQRLTTLFLLHWYFAQLENKHEDFKKIFSETKFTYETRASSKEFCEKLICKGLDIKELLPVKQNKDSDFPQNENERLSKTIKNCSWFITSWENDPTVKAMLNMLDAIHEKFSEDTNKKYFDSLVIDKKIVFHFLNFENFGLTDDLYIKMNSTGIPLSDFENFKASLEQYLKDKYKNPDKEFHLEQLKNEVDFKEYFSFMMDTEWSNLFWAHTPKDDVDLFDVFIMNFFHIVFANVYYEVTRKNQEEEGDTEPDFIDTEKSFSCQKYAELGVITQDSIKDIIVFLDMIKNGDQTQKLYFNEFKYYSETEIFSTVLNNTLRYQDRLQFYAYYKYLVKHKQIDVEGLNEWMRVICNLTENTTTYDFSRDINAIGTLIKFSSDILKHIAEGKFKGFDPYTRKEEQLKANLILKDDKWRSLIGRIELHEYFKGQIQFLFDIVDINNGNVDSIDHKKKQSTFNLYGKMFETIFNDKGVNPDFNTDYIWERALLAKGDYLIQVGANHSFCTAGKEWNTSWKRFLRDSKDKTPNILKNVFNEIGKIDGTIDANKISEALKTIIDNPDKADIESWIWREQFIAHPKLFSSEYIEFTRLINKNANHGFVLIGKGNWYCELFSLVFYLKYKDNDSFKPFKWAEKYESVKRTWNPPYAVLTYLGETGYQLDISYTTDPNDVKKYKLLFGRRKNAQKETRLIEQPYMDIVVKKHGFEPDDESYSKFIDTECNVVKVIKDLANDFTAIQDK